MSLRQAWGDARLLAAQDAVLAAVRGRGSGFRIRRVRTLHRMSGFARAARVLTFCGISVGLVHLASLWMAARDLHDAYAWTGVVCLTAVFWILLPADSNAQKFNDFDRLVLPSRSGLLLYRWRGALVELLCFGLVLVGSACWAFAPSAALPSGLALAVLLLCPLSLAVVTQWGEAADGRGDLIRAVLGAAGRPVLAWLVAMTVLLDQPLQPDPWFGIAVLLIQVWVLACCFPAMLRDVDAPARPRRVRTRSRAAVPAAVGDWPEFHTGQRSLAQNLRRYQRGKRRRLWLLAGRRLWTLPLPLLEPLLRIAPSIGVGLLMALVQDGLFLFVPLQVLALAFLDELGGDPGEGLWLRGGDQRDGLRRVLALRAARILPAIAVAFAVLWYRDFAPVLVTQFWLICGLALWIWGGGYALGFGLRELIAGHLVGVALCLVAIYGLSTPGALWVAGLCAIQGLVGLVQAMTVPEMRLREARFDQDF